MNTIKQKIIQLILRNINLMFDYLKAKENNQLSQQKIDDAFLFACQYGDLEKVENFFTNRYNKKIPNINICNGLALRKAAMAGKLEIFKFLLTSQTPPEKLKMGEHIFLCFSIASKYKHPHISQYLTSNEQFQNYLIVRQRDKLRSHIKNKENNKLIKPLKI